MSDKTHSIIAYITWVPIIIEKIYVYSLLNRWEPLWHGTDSFYMSVVSWIWAIGTFYIVLWPAFGYYDFINIMRRKFDNLAITGAAWLMVFSFVVDLVAILLIDK